MYITQLYLYPNPYLYPLLIPIDYRAILSKHYVAVDLLPEKLPSMDLLFSGISVHFKDKL